MSPDANASLARLRWSEAAWRLLVLGTVGLATVVATLAGNNPLLAAAPVLVAAGLFAAVRAPLRWSTAALLALLLVLEVPSDTSEIWHTPLVVLGDLLQGDVSRWVPGLKLSGYEVILLLLLGVWTYRRTTGSTVDGAMATATPGVLRGLFALYLLAVLYVEVNGLLRGGGVVPWKLRNLLHGPVFFLLFHTAFREAKDNDLLSRIVVLCAAWRAALAIYIQAVPAPALTGGQLAYATNHGDSIVFCVAVVYLLANLVERFDRARLGEAALLLPLLTWGMLANGRRLVWVMLGLSLATAFFVSPSRPWKRRVAAAALVLVPVLALYVAVGWGHSSKVFAPVRTLRSMTDSSTDRSTLWREREDWNISMSMQAHPILGIGLGGEYTEFMANDDMSVIFAEYREWPHNSVLGLLLLSGVVAFSAMWSLNAAVLFLAARSYRCATAPGDRVAALVSAAAMISCLVTAFGDTGPNLIQYKLFWALALAFAARLADVTGAWPAPRDR